MIRIIIIKLRRIYSCLLQETNLKALRLIIHHGWSMGRVESGWVTISVGRVLFQNLDPHATVVRLLVCMFVLL